MITPRQFCTPVPAHKDTAKQMKGLKEEENVKCNAQRDRGKSRAKGLASLPNVALKTPPL